MSIVESERNKYETLWRDVPEYRNYSPGMENVERFMRVIQPSILPNGLGPSLYDIGCGAGVAGLEFEKLGFRVTYVDITDAGLDHAVNRNNFIEAPLWSRLWGHESHDYGFCCDVMEHIPPEYTMLVADRIIECCDMTWFQIALVPDQFGATIGQPLHLTVRPFKWWLEHLREIGKVSDARDLCGQALFVVERN